MAETAALLAHEVFPDVPLRQWVISAPFPLRCLFVAHPQAMGKVPDTSELEELVQLTSKPRSHPAINSCRAAGYWKEIFPTKCSLLFLYFEDRPVATGAEP
jgi:hypothetical protein